MALLLVDFLRKRNQKSVVYSWKIVGSPFYKGRFQGRTLSVACGDSCSPFCRLVGEGAFGTNPLSRLRRQLFPFLSPDGDIFPRPGEVFSLRGSPWQNRQVSSSFVNDRTSWPVTQKLYAFAKASTFGGGGISQSEMTEGVSSGTNPLSLAALDSSSPFCRLPATSSPGRGKSFEGESPWQNQQVSSTPVNGRRSQPINPKTLRPCQSLHLRGRWHFAKRNDGRGFFRKEPSQSRCARQLSRRASPWQRGKVSSL